MRSLTISSAAHAAGLLAEADISTTHEVACTAANASQHSMAVADHVARVVKKTNFALIGPPVSPVDRRKHWARALLEGTEEEEGCGWGAHVSALAHFYAAVGVGILGQHSEVFWDDGFLPLTVRARFCFLCSSVCESPTASFSV